MVPREERTEERRQATDEWLPCLDPPSMTRVPPGAGASAQMPSPERSPSPLLTVGGVTRWRAPGGRRRLATGSVDRAGGGCRWPAFGRTRSAVPSQTPTHPGESTVSAQPAPCLCRFRANSVTSPPCHGAARSSRRTAAPPCVRRPATRAPRVAADASPGIAWRMGTLPRCAFSSPAAPGSSGRTS